MDYWIYLIDQKPKPGQRFIGASEKEWNLFTAPNHDQKDDQGKVEMTKEQHLDKIIEVFKLIKWMVPDINGDVLGKGIVNDKLITNVPTCRRGIIPVSEICKSCPYSEHCKDPRKT